MPSRYSSHSNFFLSRTAHVPQVLNRNNFNCLGQRKEITHKCLKNNGGHHCRQTSLLPAITIAPRSLRLRGDKTFSRLCPSYRPRGILPLLGSAKAVSRSRRRSAFLRAAIPCFWPLDHFGKSAACTTSSQGRWVFGIGTFPWIDSPR